jgi:hypothetical protein
VTAQFASSQLFMLAMRASQVPVIAVAVLHQKLVWQSLSLVQPVRHAVPPPLQRKFPVHAAVETAHCVLLLTEQV